MQSAGNEVGQGAKEQHIFFGEISGLRGLDIENTVELLAVKNREGDGGEGIGQNGLQRIIR